MFKKIKYIHIGLPKNLSTTLQRDFFSAHKEIMHLGVGIQTNVDYINPQIASACENHFQYSKNISYNKVKLDIKKTFDEQFEKFYKDDSKKACGISLELLSFTFTPDQIDLENKVKRVFDVFGKESKIVLIVREQFSLIESLYKEAIKIGYYGTFQEYLEYIYYSRDRNFIFDFQYDYLNDLYSKYFGKENIIILPIEKYRNSKGGLIENNGKCTLIEELSSKLGVSYSNQKLNHHNKPLSNSALNRMRELNKRNVHGIGNQFYSTGVNFHRLKDFFREELKISILDEVLYKDARIKNKNIDLANNSNGIEEIDFTYPKEIKLFLKDLFRKSNKDFQKQIDIELPKSYFNY